MVVKVKGVVIPEMRERNRLEEEIPNKSTYLKYVEHKAKVEEAMKKEALSSSSDIKREDDQPLSQASEEDFEASPQGQELSKLDFLLEKMKKSEEAGGFAEYFTLKALFNSIYEEKSNTWTREGVDRVIELVSRYSYLGAFR
jgi:hypothetical protein